MTRKKAPPLFLGWKGMVAYVAMASTVYIVVALVIAYPVYIFFKTFGFWNDMEYLYLQTSKYIFLGILMTKNIYNEKKLREEDER